MSQSKLDAARVKLQSRAFSPDNIPTEKEILLTIRQSTIGTPQSFVVFSGIPKSGKSTFMSALIASAFTPYDIFAMKLKRPENCPKIGLFDTESTDFDFYKYLCRIRDFAHLENIPHDLNAFCFREDEPEQIKLMINAYLHDNPDCKIIIIDGLLDLLIDFNDVRECKMLINWIKAITKKYGVLVISVLHTSKTSGNTLGHLGSMADRLVQSSMKIERNKEANTFDLSPAFLRSSADFEPVQIMNTTGTWQMVEHEIKENKSEFNLYQAQLLVNKVVPSQGIQYKDLLADIQETQAIGVNAAKKIIKKLIEWNLITKNSKNLYQQKRAV